MTRHARMRATLCALSTLAFAACGGGAAQQRAQSGMSDAEIAGVLETVNRGEMQQAQLAQRSATNDQVREYASQMMSDHRQALEQQQQLLSPRGITPQPSSLASQVRQRAQMAEQQLQGLEGDAFDRAYMQMQRQMHQEVLTMLEQQLIPAAQDPAYRVYLESLRDDLRAHLEHAQQLERQMAG